MLIIINLQISIFIETAFVKHYLPFIKVSRICDNSSFDVQLCKIWHWHLIQFLEDWFDGTVKHYWIYEEFLRKKICPKFDSFLLSFLQWLNEKQIVEKLIACLVPTQDEDVSSKINSIVFLFLYHSFVTFLLLTIL